MRKKTLAAIFSVYFAICAVYGISRSAMQQGDTQSIQLTPQETVTTAAQTTTAVPSATQQSNEDNGARTTTKSAETPSEQNVDDDDDDTQPDTVYATPGETTITQDTQPDVPSLDEYLKKLRCSGCRHNCSLANPRCMNGRRKASSAESEYYSLYS